MLFSSAIFLFSFLPLFLLVYFLVPRGAKNGVLLLFSLIFYAWGEYDLVLIMIASTIVDFSAGKIIGAGWRKSGLLTSIIFNLGLLIYFKYANFLIGNGNSIMSTLGIWEPNHLGFLDIVLPLGISFYTFQTMSYTIDVYRGNTEPSKNIVEFAAYVTMFPQLVAGPIVRYKDIRSQLREKDISLNNIYIGSRRFIIGLGKKMILANSCAVIADTIFNSNVDHLSTEVAWLGIIAYSLQIFFDFSGYSDMAIGLGQILGFRFLENFNLPYTAKSIKEFWRKWHISLSTWFRDYLYISLGGNRKGKGRLYLNLAIVFLVTGFWHGAGWTFIFWGMFHGLFLVLERLGGDKILNRLWIPVQHFYALFIVVLAWVFFRADNIAQAFSYFEKLFVPNSGYGYLSDIGHYYSVETVLSLGLGIVMSTSLYRNLYWKCKKGEHSALQLRTLSYLMNIVLVGILMISITYIAVGSYNPFIYFKF